MFELRQIEFSNKIQYEQNAASPPVNPANKRGNPQNINPEFKMQP